MRRSSPPEEDPPVDAAVALQPLALPAFEPEPAPVPEETVVAGAVEEERPPAAHSSPRTPEQSRPGASRRLYRGRTIGRWSALALLAGLAALVVAAIVVLAARGVTTLPGVPQFMQRYPGEYDLPVVAEPGFPAWVRWTHFLNFFLMVLIIRTGLQVRHQQKPPALWASRRDGKKISIFLWLHTSLDVIWLLNGLLFVVLLFATGHWVRIVPTSLEVFPNAVSALLQYLTLEWPTENGWVNYNSLQQLMYFSVVFIAAPIAALTGLRMSEWWPENAVRVNRIYPAKLARALHFPTMLFFVVFIVVHVFLVFATGALRNLNHMFGGRDVVNWSGFWWFAGGLFATGVMLVLAARPMVIAPIAGLFGKVSSR